MSIRNLGTAALLLAVLAGCGKNRVQVAESGLKYQIYEQDEKARKAKVGDIMTLQLTLKNAKDSVLRDTHKEPAPLQIMLQVPPFKGSFEEGLAMLGKGDSATFFVSADSLFSKAMQPLPPGVTKGSAIGFTVKIMDVQNEQEFTKTRQAAGEKQKSIDDKAIAGYIAKNGLGATVQKTPSGLNYVITQAGSGAKPTKGDNVKVHYMGKLLDGKVFDSSLNNPRNPQNKPIEFQVGIGMVIPGWDEGLQLIPKGSKATFIIPSGLAYGAQGSPPVIPANSVLLFDVDLIDVTKGAPVQQPGMPGPSGR